MLLGFAAFSTFIVDLFFELFDMHLLRPHEVDELLTGHPRDLLVGEFHFFLMNRFGSGWRPEPPHFVQRQSVTGSPWWLSSILNTMLRALPTRRDSSSYLIEHETVTRNTGQYVECPNANDWYELTLCVFLQKRQRTRPKGTFRLKTAPRSSGSQ